MKRVQTALELVLIMLLSSTVSEHVCMLVDLREAMVHAVMTACFLMDHLVSTAMIGRHTLSFRCMKRSRVDQDGTLSWCTSLILIVGGSLNMRHVLMPNAVLVAESIANRAQFDQRRADEVPDIDTVIGALSLLTVETESPRRTKIHPAQTDCVS